jgi:hypothetical protein
LVNGLFRCWFHVGNSPKSTANWEILRASTTEIVHPLFGLVAALMNQPLRLAHGRHGSAIRLPCDEHRDQLFVTDTAVRILTQSKMGKCHFHDTPLTLHHITAGKGQVQMMLAEVNGDYHFVRVAVSFRETATQNWHFMCAPPMCGVK